MSPLNFTSYVAAFRQRSRRGRKVSKFFPRELQLSRTFRPRLQELEDRTVPDGTVKLSQGLLSIIGTAGVDSALIQQIAGSQGNQSDQLAVTLNGNTSTFKV